MELDLFLCDISWAEAHPAPGMSCGLKSGREDQEREGVAGSGRCDGAGTDPPQSSGSTRT